MSRRRSTSGRSRLTASSTWAAGGGTAASRHRRPDTCLVELGDPGVEHLESVEEPGDLGASAPDLRGSCTAKAGPSLSEYVRSRPRPPGIWKSPPNIPLTCARPRAIVRVNNKRE